MGVIYTGSADGKIWKISGEKAEILNTTGAGHTECGKVTFLQFLTSFPRKVYGKKYMYTEADRSLKFVLLMINYNYCNYIGGNS